MGVIIPQVVTEDKAGGAQVIDGSLKFDGAKSHYLNRTPGSAGNRKTWTWSGWVKKNDTSSQQTLFSAGNSGTNRSNILFDSSVNGALRYFNYASSVNVNLISSQVFRDAAGWYHIVVAFDSTQATEVNRLKFYVNGVQVTNFSTATYPSQNLDVVINNNLAHSIGRAEQASPAEHLSGQISNVYFIDGQALDPSYFGYTDPLTNTWRPKKFKPQATPNDGTVWSSSLTAPGSGFGGSIPATNAFDGNLSTLAGTNNSTSANLLFTKTFTNVTRLRVWADHSTGYRMRVNGGTWYSDSTLGASANASWRDLTSIIPAGGTITSIEADTNGANNGVNWAAIEVNGVILLDSDTTNIGKNGFYLPLDGNTPIGQDQSGRGNNWTPVNFGGSNTIEKATGALPILNTDGGGKVARVGVRTDSNASSLVLALPLVGIKSDFSNAINSGTSNKAITAAGNAAASSTQSNFYGGSFYFDGSGDYLSIPTSTDFAFGTGDFTIEFYTYLTTTGQQHFYEGRNGSSTNTLLLNVDTSTQVSLYVNGAYRITGQALLTGKWYHIALARSGTSTRLFVDGVQTGSTYSDTTNYAAPTSSLFFGANDVPNSSFLQGYLQDIRVYKGTAKYTQNFIPASTDPDILPDTPSGVAYSSNVVLAPTNEGAVSLSSDGSGDYLSFSASADFGFSTPSGNSNDFTIEWFKYWTSLSGYQTIWSNNYISSPGLLIQTGNGDGKYRVFVSSGTEIFQETNAATTGKWYHYALVRNGTTYTLYRDGIANGSATSSSAAGSGSDAATIGQGNGGFYENGFISNFHVVKGTALYTTNFTPPTGPINSVANTKLLCCKSRTSATVFDVSPGTITANGDAGATNINPFTVNINTQRGQESGYATFNPLDSNSSGTLSNGNLQWASGANSHYSVRSTLSMKTGKWYAEGTVLVNTNSVGSAFGIALRTASLSSYTGDTGSWSYHSNGNKYLNGGSGSSFGTAYGTTVGNVVGLAFDADNGNLDAYCNGVYQGRVVSGLSSDDYFWMVNAYNWTWGINFGQKPFKFPPPAGFQPLALANTPRPTIVRPDQYVGISTWIGDGNSTRSISNYSFKPDFIWIKNRDSSSNHALIDTVRGTGAKVLCSDQTYADNDYGLTVSSFDRTGFTVATGSINFSYANSSTNRYVGWAWKAGGNSNTFNINDIGYSTASAAGLTAGTITPTGASVNTKSGFSIIKWNGSGASGTISHGLGNTPGLIFLKGTSSGESSENWRTYHSVLGTSPSNTLFLNLTNASSSNTERISAVGASTFTLSSGGAGVNASGQSYIAYLWAEIPGFSKFGSYKGGGSSYPYINTGFAPAWVMIKDTSTGGTYYDWHIFDNKRNPYNLGADNADSKNVLFANLAAQENQGSSPWAQCDFLSNGFRVNDQSVTINNSGSTYIYAAFAESPSFNLYGGQANAR